MSASLSTKEPRTENKKQNLFFYFVFGYLSQGFAQQFGLILQPLQRFLMKEQGLDASACASVMALLMLPWLIKPLYGVLSDFIPIFSYRRKSYLILAHLAALSGYLLIAFWSKSGSFVVPAIIIADFGMAFATVLMLALTVESTEVEQKERVKTRVLLSTQAISYYAANIIAALAGGFLCQHLEPSTALSTAALIAAFFPGLMLLLTMFQRLEEKCSKKPAGWKDDLSNLRRFLLSPNFLRAASIIFLLNAIPSINVSLYYFESNTLAFPQELIGRLAAANAMGMLMGAILFKQCIAGKFDRSTQIRIAATLLGLSFLSYLLLNSAAIGFILEPVRGMAQITSILTIYGLASDASARKLEATSMAVLIAVNNLGLELSILLGGTLFQKVFQESFPALVISSSLCAFACLFLVPLSRRIEAR